LVIAVPVSPKVQANVAAPTPPVATAVNVAGDVASIDAGVNVKLTANAAATVTVWLDVAFTASASVAVTLTVNEPEVA
jgi:hypothetical protein